MDNVPVFFLSELIIMNNFKECYVKKIKIILNIIYHMEI